MNRRRRPPTRTVTRLIEFMKLLRRDEPIPVKEIASELGMKLSNAYNWTTEMAAQGLLVETKESVGEHRGPKARHYRLSGMWGGQP